MKQIIHPFDWVPGTSSISQESVKLPVL